MSDKIIPWSETRSEEPTHLPDNLAGKNLRLLNPLAAPDLYFELYDNGASEVIITDPATDEQQTYELVKNINNPESGFHAKVIKDAETGHHILITKGMDMPGRDEGAGRTGFMDDLGDLKYSSLQTCISDQVIDAEKAYLDLLEDPQVQTLEVVGYSIGTIPANYYASVYDAQVTNIADLGVPGSVEGSTQNFLAHTFNWCNNGAFPGAHGKFEENLNQNVVGLRMRADMMGGALGAAGNEYGKQVTIDKDSLNFAGGAHVPQVYADAIKENFPESPTTETTKTLQTDIWKP